MQCFAAAVNRLVFVILVSVLRAVGRSEGWMKWGWGTRAVVRAEGGFAVRWWLRRVL